MSESSAIMINGKREWVTYNTQSVDDEDFIKLGNEYDKEKNIIIHKVGNADVRFMKQRPLIDWTAHMLLNSSKTKCIGR